MKDSMNLQNQTRDATGQTQSDEEPSAYVAALCRVARVERPSPTFARITFAGPDLDIVGNQGACFDVRIKLVFPSTGHPSPRLSGVGSQWYQQWLDMPPEERGSMRTYSIRELTRNEHATTIVVDFVLHNEPGHSGPASEWAAQASKGDELLLVGPRRHHAGTAGIEFLPGDAAAFMLAGDETAAPAIARILEDSEPTARGIAMIEVPGAEDVLPIAAPAGVEVIWLPRDGADVGAALIPAVAALLGSGDQPAIEAVPVDDSADLPWETPAQTPADPRETFYWIAGESTVVTTLRRHLVKDLGIDRSQVAFMGYWKRGVAMRG